ncbi:cytochrome P450 2J4-like [Dermacentor variabilis]|uniref:cytochrome P450 2J4-like n=1 Tax=Dermacentor variabilis TaxID=34621 RepID=UPI003F5B59CF
MLEAVMWECTITALVVALVAPLLHYLWFSLRRMFRPDLPPGPRGLPLLGYLPFMTEYGHRDIERLKQKYGNVFGLQLGFRYVVFLCDFGSIKEALSNDALLDRPHEFPLNVHEKSQSMILANGPRWKEQRRFTIRTFKTLTSTTRVLQSGTTQTLETHIHDELSYVVRELASRKGEPVAIASLLSSSTSNVITALVYGRRLEYGSPERVELDELADGIPALAAQISSINFFPWLRRVLSVLRIGACGRLRSALIRRDRLSETLIGLHEKTYQDGVVRDYVDAFLSEMRRPEQEKKTFTHDGLKSNASSIFGAGSETVRSAIEWLVLTCAAKPEVQNRVRAEIDVVLGQSGHGSRVVWEDRSRMPYTQAFIWEVARYEPINPLGLMRCASEDTKISGYVIPRGSIVVPSLRSIFYDTSFWEDPEVFRPERFLVEGGTRASKPERLIPFSYGKRSCPGEMIANMETFIFLTTILQHFIIEVPPSGPALAFDEVLTISLRPRSQELVFRARQMRR